MEYDMRSLRRHVLELLNGGHAHATFDQAVKDLPVIPSRQEAKRRRALRLADPRAPAHRPVGHPGVLRNPKHKSPDWPSGYWPAKAEPPDDKAWDKSVRAFRKDLKALCAMVGDENTDLFAAIPHGTGQTALREALLAADHNAYHLGELVLVRRMLGAWK